MPEYYRSVGIDSTLFAADYDNGAPTAVLQSELPDDALWEDQVARETGVQDHLQRMGGTIAVFDVESDQSLKILADAPTDHWARN